MRAWTLNWNGMTNEQRSKIVKAADYNVCQCCGDAGQTALDVFNAVISVINERDRAEVKSTISTQPKGPKP